MNDSRTTERNRPKYRISVIARMLDIHPQTIRTYERLGLIEPARSSGNTRLFSDRDKILIEKIQTLTQEMGVNLAGVEIILKMLNQIENMNNEADNLFSELKDYFANTGQIPDSAFFKIFENLRWLKLDSENLE